MRRQLRARAEIFRRFEQARAEVGLPDAVHKRTRRRRRFFIREPFRQREPRAIGVRRELMEETGHAGLDDVRRLEEFTALEQMRLAGFDAGLERQLRFTFGPLLPELFDLHCGFGELGQRAPPVVEHGGDLRGRTLLARDGEDVAHALRHGVRHDRPRVRCHAEAEAAEVVVLMQVAARAAVPLDETNVPDGSAREARVRRALENGLPVAIAPPRPRINTPRRVLVVIVGERRRADDAVVRRLVVMLRAQRRLGLLEVRRGCSELETRHVRRIQRRRIHGEFRQRANTLERAARAIRRKIGIGHQLDAERGDVLQIVCQPEMRRGLCDGVTLCEERAVRLREIALAARRDVLHAGLNRNPLRLILRDGIFPLRHALLPAGRLVAQTFFQVAHLAGEIRGQHLLLRRVNNALRLVVVVEEGEQLVVILLQDRVELVVVALRALDRQAQHAFADGVHAVEHRLHAELLRVGAAFFVDHRVAEKTGGNNLILRCVRKLVARELLGDELIVRQVAVECVHHPVAIERHVARLVFLEAVRVRITRRIEPLAAPLLAVMRRRKQPLHLLLVGVRRFVGEKRIHFLRRRRQADEIEREPA